MVSRGNGFRTAQNSVKDTQTLIPFPCFQLANTARFILLNTVLSRFAISKNGAHPVALDR